MARCVPLEDEPKHVLSIIITIGPRTHDPSLLDENQALSILDSRHHLGACNHDRQKQVIINTRVASI